MPWSETSPSNEGRRFNRDYRSGPYGMTELCQRLGISRKPGYKWIDRDRGSSWPGSPRGTVAPPPGAEQRRNPPSRLLKSGVARLLWSG
jgi:hypothetical protein